MNPDLFMFYSFVFYGFGGICNEIVKYSVNKHNYDYKIMHQNSTTYVMYCMCFITNILKYTHYCYKCPASVTIVNRFDYIYSLLEILVTCRLVN